MQKDALLGVKDALLLEDLGKDGDGRVDGVGDDQNEGLGSGLGDGLSESGADTGVDLLDAGTLATEFRLMHSESLTLNKSSRLCNR